MHRSDYDFDVISGPSTPLAVPAAATTLPPAVPAGRADAASPARRETGKEDAAAEPRRAKG